jgi:hypothetical protein
MGGHGAIDATEIATGLLLEARAGIAEDIGASAWRARARTRSPNDAIVKAWESHPHPSAAARKGFAIARRALEQAAGPAFYDVADATAVIRVLDRALADLRT